MSLNVPYPGILVDPSGLTVVVNITDGHSNLASAYADAYGVTPVTFPKTISARTTYYLPAQGPWTVSVKLAGQELAGQTIVLEDGEIATVGVTAVTGVLSGTAGGDLSGSFPNPTVAKLNGTALSGLATGLLKNTTGTGVPSIASTVTDYLPAPTVMAGHVFATNMVGGGADNLAYLQGLVNGLPATGGTIYIPAGTWAISAPLQINTSGVTLQGPSSLQPTDDPGGLRNTAIGAYIVPTAGFAIGTSPQLALIYVNASNCLLHRVNLNSNGATTPVAYIVYAEGTANRGSDFIMDACSWQGACTTASVYIAGSPSANRVELRHCYGNSQDNPNTQPTLSFNASDGKITNCRFKGGTKLFNNAGNMVCVGGHWTGGAPALSVTGSGTIHLIGVLFDSANAIATISHAGTGNVILAGTDLYSQVQSNFPALVKTGTGRFVINGINLASNQLSNGWQYLATGLGQIDQITSINIGAGALQSNNGVGSQAEKSALRLNITGLTFSGNTGTATVAASAINALDNNQWVVLSIAGFTNGTPLTGLPVQVTIASTTTFTFTVASGPTTGAFSTGNLYPILTQDGNLPGQAANWVQAGTPITQASMNSQLGADIGVPATTLTTVLTLTLGLGLWDIQAEIAVLAGGTAAEVDAIITPGTATVSQMGSGPATASGNTIAVAMLPAASGQVSGTLRNLVRVTAAGTVQLQVYCAQAVTVKAKTSGGITNGPYFATYLLATPFAI